MVKIIAFALLYSFTALSGESCSLAMIINEVAKFHGPEWSKIATHCHNNEIKGHLKKIILLPEENLSEYDQENQKFIYRNSVKSYGHFGNQVQDLSLLANVYNDKNQTVERLFGGNANFFRITVLEAMANTGNIESLNFFQKIMENDNNVLFLQQHALNFAGWILEGSPFKADDYEQGSKMYGEYFFPNLQSHAETRLKNNPQLLEKLSEKKIHLKNLVQDMLLRSDRFAPISSTLKKLDIILNTDLREEMPDLKKTTVKDFSHKINGKNNFLEVTDTNKNVTRSLASAPHEENQDKTANTYLWIISFLIGCVTLLYFFFRKKT